MIDSFRHRMASRARAIGLLLLVTTPAAFAMTNEVAREQDIVGLRLGQRVLVDDGTCPAGQIKQVMGAKINAGGVMAEQKCVPRTRIKTK